MNSIASPYKRTRHNHILKHTIRTKHPIENGQKSIRYTIFHHVYTFHIYIYRIFKYKNISPSEMSIYAKEVGDSNISLCTTFIFCYQCSTLKKTSDPHAAPPLWTEHKKGAAAVCRRAIAHR